MLKKIVIVLAVVVVLFLAFVATRPSTYQVTRTAAINAPAETVFTYLADLHNWNSWSPWAGRDPNLKTTYSGAPSGVGAIYEWNGNDQVGSGRMKVTDVKPSEQVGIELTFLKPWESTNRVEFTLASSGGATNTTWAMKGNHNFISKAFSVFMDMEKMMGPDFEAGLAKLKTLTEAKAKEQAAVPAAAPAAPPPPAPTH
jgi:uncharacterized protein YndB with AHSA1/START domain